MCRYSCKQEIALGHVTADYGGAEAALKDFSYAFRAHGCYAILGESGSGKTTLLNLLTGFHRQYSGSIRYDGIVIRDASNESLCQIMSVIDQDVFIFDAAIAENISMFHPCSDAALQDPPARRGFPH